MIGFPWFIIIVAAVLWFLGWLFLFVASGRWIILRRPYCWTKGHKMGPLGVRCGRCWKVLVEPRSAGRA